MVLTLITVNLAANIGFPLRNQVSIIKIAVILKNKCLCWNI